MPTAGSQTSDPAPLSATEFVSSINAALQSFLEQQQGRVGAIAKEGIDLVKSISALSLGGKRIRPLFAWYGWQIAGADPHDERVRQLGVSLELFQAAALIHDDILDRSDTRRGQPSAHRSFEALHVGRGWDQDAEHFGVSAGILAGDLSLALSEEVFASVVLEVSSTNRDAATSARTVFDDMRFEVMTGQYLDIREESAGSFHTPDIALERAMTILQYKSAKYSVERPLMLGAAAAGATPELLAQLSALSLPLGEAFQLRDDQLGVFGDPDVTGKPSGDDLREGKRTALIAYARAASTEAQQQLIDDRLGVSNLSEAQISELQELIRSTGAEAKIEELIAAKANQAFGGIDALDCPTAVKAGLHALAEATINRQK